ncbi:hypothetical protein skT53_29790 [Effusibacillus dendaii]|uniref:HTH lysR-type domain-containing protein n=1 Tax=Effusibacillus dendaii TaxID=2743772 RepID=A0A7I8DD12_9BACL|nr:hypothetical protein skT53_29790 [Effusibacillus dendaii]
MFVSQPALSKQISILERTLQISLFERTSKGINLTEKGKQFYARIEPLIQEVDMVLEEFVLPEEFRIGALPSISSYYLPTVMNLLGSMKLKTFVENTSDELLEKVQSGELDLAIVQDRHQYGNLKHLYLFEEPYVVALPDNHPLVDKEWLEMKDFHAE